MAFANVMTVFAFAVGGHAAEMDCGDGVPLCGIVALQTGLGGGAYASEVTKVHGLWPQNGRYGTSKCIPPVDATNPTRIYDCYVDPASEEHALWFENHEWKHHGLCAGAKDAEDFFEQVCSISKDPLAVMEEARQSSNDFQLMADALRDRGFPVYSLDSNHDQVMLSACAGDDGRWVLADVYEMPSKCASSSDVQPLFNASSSAQYIQV